MIVYRDMTFCTSKCDNYNCIRKLTRRDREMIKLHNYWVSYADMSEDCKDYIDKKGNKINE